MSNTRRASALLLYALLLLSLSAFLAAPAMAVEAAPSETPVIEQGPTIAPPAVSSEGSGGAVVGDTIEEEPGTEPDPEAKPGHPKPDGDTEDGGDIEPAGAVAAPEPSEVFEIPSVPTSTCATSGVPPVLIPIYQRAATTYGLGPQGAAILAGINAIETAFGSNLNISSAGAVGWMQFMPETWEAYGVDANGDGVRDPYNPEDAIFAAANYLSASGMPSDTYDAIFAYNHADWYVAEVLANAACYGSLGGTAAGFFSLTPQLQVLDCRPAPAWRDNVPDEYLAAFEAAAARYELGRRGVWALAAVARLESNFGRGMGKRQLQKFGPLGLDRSEWADYAVDGDEDGRVRRGDPDDSAATLARLIWSQGSLRAGVFSHNQAAWYVAAVLAEAEELNGKCEVTTVNWALALPETAVAPINWQNLTLSNELELQDLTSGVIDPRVIGLIGAITQEHQLTISSLRSDHSQYTVSGNISNHSYGRALDIAAVDGVSCTDTGVNAPCANLGRTLAYLPAPIHPTELIYCFDLDGPGMAFALADHCDHIHAGYDS